MEATIKRSALDMKSVDTGKDKVKKICEVLKRETLDPAKKEADAIIHQAREEAAKIVEKAKHEAQKVHREAQKKIEEERNVFESSMNLACKKSLSTLKQEIEQKLFNSELSSWIRKGTQDPHVLAELISAIVKGIEKEGLDANLEVLIPSTVSAKAVNQTLVKGIAEKLKEKSVKIGEFEGGAEVKIVDQNITIDMTDDALKALVASFVRDDFRSAFFGNA
ncbi:ATP synthase subunit E [Simkania negevensis]|uniref:V-type proton ATPase subunit E n=1 Tax=Simkania negevensis (strain ATCC VR-1471 / DSM 27360 / Z) TaxID=331113 RepID=F8L956_SIMNZ|nr:ATP synthase subunit E [Simkania negevensis]MCB1066797.1 V-type ATP synthase subunit E [Simkania sp.]CCB89371.1 v-type proton ATPase subunit E [Simkania negevensis Z]